MNTIKMIPVLDEDSYDGMVIGYASSAEAAAQVYRDCAWLVPITPLTAEDFRHRREPVTYDADINTREQAEDVERRGAWAPVSI